MSLIRRTYAYLLALAGLAILSLAAANLVQLLLDVLLGASYTTRESAVRDGVARDVAALLVGLPVWLVHWRWIERTARREPAERASSLRQAFVYVVLAAAMLIGVGALSDSLRAIFGVVLDTPVPGPAADAIVRPLPFAVVAFGVWWAHWRRSVADRAHAGETGRSATLRRWYVYGAAFVSLVALLSNVQAVVQAEWRLATGAGAPAGAGLAAPAAWSVVALAAWTLHWAVLPARLRVEHPPITDETSTLRAVYLFLSLAVGVLGALLGASQLLYYGLARVLGVAQPGGVGGDLRQAVAGPASLTLVYGAAWLYHRAALRPAQAGPYAERPRQAGTRRLYTHVIAVLALAVWTSGVAGLLWTVGDALVAPPPAGSDTLREQVALFATAVVVGLPVWLRVWRPRPSALAEAQALSRRLYVYVSLIAATLALVGSVGGALYRLLGLALGEPFSVQVGTDLAHALAVALVGGIVAAYHWRVLRGDTPRSLAAVAGEQVPPQPVAGIAGPVVVQIEAADPAALAHALSTLRATGVQVTVLQPAPPD